MAVGKRKEVLCVSVIKKALLKTAKGLIRILDLLCPALRLMRSKLEEKEEKK